VAEAAAAVAAVTRTRGSVTAAEAPQRPVLVRRQCSQSRFSNAVMQPSWPQDRKLSCSDVKYTLPVGRRECMINILCITLLDVLICNVLVFDHHGMVF
jgi:hypothetical protein